MDPKAFLESQGVPDALTAADACAVWRVGSEAASTCRSPHTAALTHLDVPVAQLFLEHALPALTVDVFQHKHTVAQRHMSS